MCTLLILTLCQPLPAQPVQQAPQVNLLAPDRSYDAGPLRTTDFVADAPELDIRRRHQPQHHTEIKIIYNLKFRERHTDGKVVFTLRDIELTPIVRTYQSWTRVAAAGEWLEDAQAHFDLAAIYAAQLNTKLLQDAQDGKPLRGEATSSSYAIRRLENKLASLLDNKNWDKARSEYEAAMAINRQQYKKTTTGPSRSSQQTPPRTTGCAQENEVAGNRC